MKNINEIIIKQLTEDDWQQLRHIRLESLQDSPTNFGSSYDEEIQKSDEEWRSWPNRCDAFGVFLEDILIGSCRFSQEFGAKLSHKGNIYGMYIKPKYRGNGIAKMLIKAVIAHGKKQNCTQIHLTCVATNTAAINVYAKYGFKIYGIEPNAIKVDDKFYDEYLMVLKDL